MNPVRAFIFAVGAAALVTLQSATIAAAQAPKPETPSSDPGESEADQASLTQKLNAYVGCINRLSGRSYDSRRRYFSWVGKSGPTGKERIIYGTYTIYDTSDCRKNIEAANAMEPRDEALEAAASAYADAVGKLEPLLKEANEYYSQEDYKDDKMAKGKALHPRLVATWDAFAKADKTLREGVETINDRRAAERVAAIEKSEGKSARYHTEALMIEAKRVLRTETADKPDMNAINAALNAYENQVKALDQLDGDAKVDSFFLSAAKGYLTSAKQLMRRIRDKTPLSQGDRMMINAGGGEMIEGTPQRLLRNYNDLVGAYNSRLRRG